MTWLLAAVSLTATFLNTRKLRICFALWFGTNVSWAFVNGFIYGNAARATLDGCYAALSIYGWLKWRSREETNR